MKRLIALALILMFLGTTTPACHLPKPNWHKVKKVAIYAGVTGAAVGVTLLADRDHHKRPQDPDRDHRD